MRAGVWHGTRVGRLSLPPVALVRPLHLCQTNQSHDGTRLQRRPSMHTWSRRLIMLVLIGSLLLVGHALRSEAGEPLDKIRVTVDDVMDIIANKNLDPQQRRTQIRQAVLK